MSPFQVALLTFFFNFAQISPKTDRDTRLPADILMCAAAKPRVQRITIAMENDPQKDSVTDKR
jgi:hypothetical protein